MWEKWARSKKSQSLLNNGFIALRGHRWATLRCPGDSFLPPPLPGHTREIAPTIQNTKEQNSSRLKIPTFDTLVFGKLILQGILVIYLKGDGSRRGNSPFLSVQERARWRSEAKKAALMGSVHEACCRQTYKMDIADGKCYGMSLCSLSKQNVS